MREMIFLHYFGAILLSFFHRKPSRRYFLIGTFIAIDEQEKPNYQNIYAPNSN